MKRFIILLLVLMTGGFAIQRFILTPMIANSNFELMPLIPLFFIMLGLVSMFIVKSKPNASVILLLIVKMMKILLSLAVILLYVIFIKENATAFLFSFLSYFIIYLVYETWMLSKMNKKKVTNNE